MALSTYNLKPQADATNRYTASAAVDVNLSNPNRSHVDLVCWTLTTSDTAPAATPNLWNKVLPGESKAMTLQAGERLWLACEAGTSPAAALEA